MERFNLITSDNSTLTAIEPPIRNLESDDPKAILHGFDSLDDALSYLLVYSMLSDIDGKDVFVYLNNELSWYFDSLDRHDDVSSWIHDDYIEIGSSFGDDPCQQFGTPSYNRAFAKLECQAMVRSIERNCSPIPEGASAKIARADEGYYEVHLCYNTGKFDQVTWALKVEDSLPETLPDTDKRWLKEQKKALQH